ncbi:MAG: hypothetical protein ACP5P4_13535 [Steroidobacteraceae bacterium]
MDVAAAEQHEPQARAAERDSRGSFESPPASFRPPEPPFASPAVQTAPSGPPPAAAAVREEKVATWHEEPKPAAVHVEPVSAPSAGGQDGKPHVVWTSAPAEWTPPRRGEE